MSEIAVELETEQMDGRAVDGLAVTADKKTSLSAPILRVEKIRDELAVPSEEESTSPGEFSPSDQDRASSQGDADNQLDPLILPDALLRDKINEQAEFYFSDEHLLKDAFLLKHVKRNKQGFVSIKLLTSFKRIKCLTKDYRVVAYSLEFSRKLEVNPEKTKVRRREPLPDHDETPPSRTVVAVNLPSENPSIESVAELFSECGEIALIRILRPTKTVPGDIKKYCGKHPEIGTTLCAVVEFEQHDSAVAASNINAAVNDNNVMRVALLASKKPNQPKPKAKGKKTKDDGKRHSWKDDEVADNLLPAKGEYSVSQPIEIKAPSTSAPDVVQNRSRGSSPRQSPGRQGRGSPNPPRSGSPRDQRQGSPRDQKQGSPNEKKTPPSERRGSKDGKRGKKLGDELNDLELSSSPSDRDMNWRLGPNRGVDRSKLSPMTTPINSPRASPRASPRSSPRQMRRSYPKSSPLAANADGLGVSPKPSPLSSPEPSRRIQSPAGGDASPGGSPWVQRRLKVAQESPLTMSPRGSPLIGRRGCPEMEGVVRQPRGPDGTRGFGAGRGQIKA